MTRASKITIILSLIIVALFIITRVSDDSNNQNFLEPYQEDYIFTTEDGWKGTLTYTKKDKSEATLNIRNKDYQLSRTEAASGTKYESEDKNVTYWEHGGEATVEASGINYQIPTLQKAELIIMNIASEKRDCVGEAQMKCLEVNGELFYDDIKGFGFEEGVEYEIKVARTERENVPADASAYEYELIKVLSATPVKETAGDNTETESEENTEGTDSSDNNLNQTSWNYDGGSVSFENGRYMADFGCNSISGAFTINDDAISFEPSISTEMFCSEEIADKEQNFANLITQMTGFSITEGGLTLSGEGQEMVFSKE